MAQGWSVSRRARARRWLRSTTVVAVFALVASVFTLVGLPTASASACDASVSDEAGLVAAIGCYNSTVAGEVTNLSVIASFALTDVLPELTNTTTATLVIAGGGSTITGASGGVDMFRVQAGDLTLDNLELASASDNAISVPAAGTVTLRNGSSITGATNAGISSGNTGTPGSATITLSDSSISGVTDTGIFAGIGTVVIERSMISGASGSLLRSMSAADITVVGSVLDGLGTASTAITQNGAGALASVTIENSTVRGFSTGAFLSGPTTITDSTLHNNNLGLSVQEDAEVDVTNSTLVGRGSGVAGTAISTQAGSTIDITGSTIVDYATVIVGSGAATFIGTLVARENNGGCNTFSGLSVTDGGGNVFSSACLQFPGPVTLIPSTPDADAGVGVLSSNPCGPAVTSCTDTVPLLASSAAVDAWGTCAPLDDDQRGVARTAGKCDAGAYEAFDCPPATIATEAALDLAIRCYNESLSGTTAVTLTADIVLTARPRFIENATDAVLAIDGGGHTITLFEGSLGVVHRDGDLRIEDLTITGGTGDGVVLFGDADLSLTESAITNITGTAIEGTNFDGPNASEVKLTRSTLSGNVQGIDNVFDVVIDSSTLTGSTFKALQTGEGVTTVMNSTFAANANALTVLGGATTVRNSTFALNTGTAISMFTFGATGTVEFIDSMSFNNSGACGSSLSETTPADDPDGVPRTVDGGGNIMGGDCGPIMGVTTNPPVGRWFQLLPALALNTCAVGVTCTETIATPPGFPTAGAGAVCGLATDQRGVARPGSGCDSGAYEQPNQPPSANPDNVLSSVDEDAPSFPIDVLINDTDPDGDQLLITAVSNLTPSAGSVTVDGDGLGVTYVPAENFNGPVTFNYDVSDGNGGTDSSSVSFNVNRVDDEPDARDDAFEAVGNTVGGQATTSFNVIANDIEVDGDVLGFAPNGLGPISPEGAGIVSFSFPNINFEPAPEFVGEATFTYTIQDSFTGTRFSDTATVTVTVTDVNDAPIANDDISPGFVLDEDDPATVLDVLANDTDADAGDTLFVFSVDQPARGGVAAVVDGELVFVPQADFAGFSGRFSYTVSDGNGGTDVAELAVQINAVNDPPRPVVDNITANENTTFSFQPWRNDVDPEGKSLSIASVTQPRAGTGTASVTSNSFVNFTPASGFIGTTSFTYTVQDPEGLTAVATINVDVIDVNDAPVAVNDFRSGIESVPLVIDVLENDTDPDDDALTITEVTAPTMGTATITDGKVTYTGDAGFFGVDTFQYTVSDGGETSEATVRVFLAEANPNQSPSAVDDVFAVVAGRTTSLDVLANDTDPENTELTIVSVTQPFPIRAGTAEISADGKSIVLDALPGFVGRARVFYIMRDADGKSGSATAFMDFANGPFVSHGRPTWDTESDGLGIASNTAGHAVTIAVKEDGNLYVRRMLPSGQFGTFVKLGRGGWASADVAMDEDGRVEIVAVKQDGRLFTRSWLLSGTFGPWTSHGAATWDTQAQPSVATSGSRIVYAAVKADGRLFTRERGTSTGWGSFMAQGASGWAQVDLDMAFDGDIWFAAVKDDGRLFVRKRIDGRWSGFASQGRATWDPTVPPSVGVRSSGVIYAALKTDGRLFTRQQISGRWLGFVAHGRGSWASVGVDINESETAVLVATKTSGALFSHVYDESWGAWTLHGRATWSTTASPAVSIGSRSPQFLAVKADGTLYTRSFK